MWFATEASVTELTALVSLSLIESSSALDYSRHSTANSQLLHEQPPSGTQKRFRKQSRAVMHYALLPLTPDKRTFARGHPNTSLLRIGTTTRAHAGKPIQKAKAHAYRNDLAA